MNHNVAVTLENFQNVIIETSKTKLVLVAFWAEQIPESVELVNKLSASLANFSEHITLATVDCQTQQQIAQQFGIQGLPTAILVQESQPLDGLSGPQTDESIQEFLNKYLPKPEDILLAQAKVALESGDVNAAFTDASQAYQLDNERADIKLVLADTYLQTGKLADAETLLATVKMADQDSHYQALVAKLELATQAAESPEIKALEQQLTQTPDNVELIQQLATQYSQVNRYEDALVLLFRLMQTDSSDQHSKTLYIDLLKTLPEGDALATKYRRKLYTLMY